MERLKYNSLFAVLPLCAMACVPSLVSAEYLSEEDLYEEEVSGVAEVSDPLEAINRVTFEVNDFLYLGLIQPFADGYQAITPDPVEEGASNFFKNLKFPVRFAGNLLQGKLDGAWVETQRFVVNSTVGVLGVMRPADEMEGLEPLPDEDFGQVLASWGVGEGPYLVLPLFGPSNLRDLGGIIGDRAIDPLSEPFSAIDDWDWEAQTALGVASFTASSPSLMDTYLQMKGSAIDPYSAIKNAYTQFRRAAVEE